MNASRLLSVTYTSSEPTYKQFMALVAALDPTVKRPGEKKPRRGRRIAKKLDRERRRKMLAVWIPNGIGSWLNGGAPRAR